jgi:hypothetical protein
METAGRWWNGSFGTMSRRDIYLRTSAVWTVELRQGGSDGRSNVRRFGSEAEARAFVKQCQIGPGHWRELAVDQPASIGAEQLDEHPAE